MVVVENLRELHLGPMARGAIELVDPYLVQGTIEGIEIQDRKLA